MSRPPRMVHLAHPTDTRRKGFGYWRTACGRWAGLAAFWHGHTAQQGRPLCPKCAVAQLLAELPTGAA